MGSTKERAALYLNSFGWGRGVPITGIDFDSLVVMLSGFASSLEEDKWISTDDEFPPSGQCVMLYSKEGGVAEGAWIASKNHFEQWRWNATITYVTHWMPLPKFKPSNQ